MGFMENFSTLVFCWNFALFFFSGTVEDTERNDGSTQRPYHMPQRLLQMLASDNDILKLTNIKYKVYAKETARLKKIGSPI